jgi:hypothetical protein
MELYNMKTAVEWLENELELVLPTLEGEYLRFFKEAINQAKEMEKQQIIDAYREAITYGIFSEDAEEYFKETFNK